MTALTRKQAESVIAQQIGHCTTCDYKHCEVPKRREQNPQAGCGLWENKESRKQPEPPTCTVEK